MLRPENSETALNGLLAVRERALVSRLATLFSILIRFSFDSKQIWHVYHEMTASPVGSQAACPNIL